MIAVLSEWSLLNVSAVAETKRSSSTCKAARIKMVVDGSKYSKYKNCDVVGQLYISHTNREEVKGHVLARDTVAACDVVLVATFVVC